MNSSKDLNKVHCIC